MPYTAITRMVIIYFTVGSYGPTAVSDGHTFVKVSPTPTQAYISSSTDFTHWIPRDTVATGLAQALYDSTQFMAPMGRCMTGMCCM
jgi:hypothetical protein